VQALAQRDTVESVPCSKDPLDRFLGASLLCTTGYMHWAQSHLAHHVKVASLLLSGHYTAINSSRRAWQQLILSCETIPTGANGVAHWGCMVNCLRHRRFPLHYCLGCLGANRMRCGAGSDA